MIYWLSLFLVSSCRTWLYSKNTWSKRPLCGRKHQNHAINEQNLSIFRNKYNHPFFSRGTPLQKSELYTNYLLAGVGAVIFMVLFMIVIEIRKKSKPRKRKPLLLTKNMKIKRVMKPLNDFQMAAVKQIWI